MSRYELTISSDYVRHWGVWEGVREFFQNAIDEQNSNPDHKMSWEYEDERLTITSYDCKLSINSLLLGNTSKSDGRSIGQFGEGYKVAIVVLLREGKKITIHNGDELWNVRFVNSRRFRDQVPVIETSKFGVTGSDLVIEIEGITEDEWEEIVSKILYIREEVSSLNKIETEYGDLLSDKSERGNIYVEGIFIVNKEDLKYGYNFRSDSITLNRDRNMASGFEITWNSSRILAKAFSKDVENLYSIIESQYTDADYINGKLSEVTVNRLFEYFKEINKDRIPVSTQEEYDYFESKGMSPIFVNNITKTIFSGFYQEEYDEEEVKNSLFGELLEKLEEIKQYIPESNYNDFKNLICDYEHDLKQIELTE